MKFYVYVLVRPDKADGTVFYVGKGSGRRVNEHEYEARSGHKCHKCSVIRKVWKQGGQIQRYIIFTTDDEAEAFAYERETIALYGRANLCNHTDGGEGSLNLSPEAKARKSATLRRVMNTDERRTTMRRHTLRRWTDPAYREATIRRMKEVASDPVIRAARRQVMLRRWADPPNREAARQRMDARWADPDYQEEIRQASVQRWADPEYREKVIKRQAEGYARPEVKARMSEVRRKPWTDPEYKARMSAKRAALQSTPEHRAKVSATSKAMWSGNTELRERVSASMKARWTNPMYREEMVTALRARYADKPKKFCAIDGCDRAVIAKGLCSAHYEAARRKAAKEQS